MPNVANRQYVLWPVAIPTIVPIQSNTTGYQLQLFVPRHVIQYIDTDPTGENPATRTTIEVPPVIVTMLVPVNTPTVNFDADGLSPYPNVISTSATAAFCVQTVETQDPNGAWVQPTVSNVPEPTWVQANAGSVAVTVLGPFLGGASAATPEAMYPGAQRAYISYEIAGSANINQTHVNTSRLPFRLRARSTTFQPSTASMVR